MNRSHIIPRDNLIPADRVHDGVVREIRRGSTEGDYVDFVK